MINRAARLLCLVLILVGLALVGMPEVLPLADLVQLHRTLLIVSPPTAAECTPLALRIPSSVRLVTGDLSDQLDLLMDTMPGAGSEGFAIPSSAEMRALGTYVASCLTGAVPPLDASLGLDPVHFTDRGDGAATSLLLRGSSSRASGWGLYALRLGPATDVVLEVPHPVADRDTQAVGLAAYRVLHARALLIAGAHRDANRDGSADVAHNPQTAFQAVHQSLVDSCPVVIVQIHGFASGIREGYPDVVLSSAEARGREVQGRLAECLRAERLTVGVCNGIDWLDLCGETSVQALAMGTSTFVHIELAESVRTDPDGFIAALERVLGS